MSLRAFDILNRKAALNKYLAEEQNCISEGRRQYFVSSHCVCVAHCVSDGVDRLKECEMSEARMLTELHVVLE